jgi:DnaJ family protein A protein 5
MPPVRCHYEVLEVARDVSDDELKKTYRKLALKWHPDKNQDNEEEATERFKEIQNSYAVLSDPQERSWYDAHRDSILRGGSGTASNKKDGGGGTDEEAFDLWAFFSTSAYSGFGDSSDSFYSVYAKVFADLAADEARHGEARRPPFGSSKSNWTAVREFYGWWEGFCTMRPCASADLYDTRTAPNRQVRRAMEKENDKARSELRRKLNDVVHKLVAYVKKRDRRVQAHKEEEEAERTAKAARAAEERKAKQGQYDAERKLFNQKLAAERGAEEEEELKRIDAMLNEYGDEDEDDGGGGTSARRKSKGKKGKGGGGGGGGGGGSSHKQQQQQQQAVGCEEVVEDVEASPWAVLDDNDELMCVACDKRFKNASQWSNHEKSKKHLEKVKQLRAELEAEDEAFAQEEEEEEDEDEDEDEDEEEEEEEEADAADGKAKTSKAGEEEEDNDDEDEEQDVALPAGSTAENPYAWARPAGAARDLDDEMEVPKEAKTRTAMVKEAEEAESLEEEEEDSDVDEDDEDAMLRRMAGSVAAAQRSAKGGHAPKAAAAAAPPEDERADESADEDEEGDQDDEMLQRMAAASVSSSAGKLKPGVSDVPPPPPPPAPPPLPPKAAAAAAAAVAADGGSGDEDEDEDDTAAASTGRSAQAAADGESGRVRGAPATLGKSKAKAKKAARKASQADSGAQVDELRCAVCKFRADTRNQLFKHLKDTGHAVAPRR